MKRLIVLALALCMVVGYTASANAIEVQISGIWDTTFIFNDNLGFSKEDVTDHFGARQRFRPQIEFIASENLRGVMQLESRIHWGQSEGFGGGGQLDTNSNTFKVRTSYVDWNVADTSLNVKMGLQNMAFPSKVRGNPFFGGNVAGVIASAGVNDNVTLSALWARPWLNAAAEKAKHNETDIFGLVADFNFAPVSVSPWLTWARAGNRSGFWEYDYNGVGSGVTHGKAGDSDIFGGGVAAKFDATDKLSFAFDGVYAKLSNDGRENEVGPEGDGYFVALAADYKAGWGTPGAFAWYSSGDSKSDREQNKFGRLVNMGADNGVAFTRMGFMGAAGLGTDTVVTAVGAGTWGLGLQLADLSFTEKLSHVARVAYYSGTNAKKDGAETYNNFENGVFGEVLYLTREDNAFEVNFDSTYQIEKGFSVVLELGWIYLDIDENSFEYRGDDMEDANAYNAQFKFRYSF